MTRPLTDFRVLTFDCYGTLIDWETGMWEALQPLVAGSEVTQHEALGAFGGYETRHEMATPDAPYPVVLARVHHDLADHFGLETTDELDAAFGASIPNWPAFPDSAEALCELEQRYRLVILSNVDRASFAASNRLLGVEFDAVYTAQDIGAYKPDPVNFAYMLDRLDVEFGLAPDHVLHTAQSLYHDHVPAKELGLATAWIDRQRLSEGGDWGATAKVDVPPEPDYVFFSMEELATAVARSEGGPGWPSFTNPDPAPDGPG
jgi:2-haloalkanoic acid dehalogenase type II